MRIDILATIQFDPEPEMADIEATMVASGDFQLERCFREQGRVWSESEFNGHLEALLKAKRIKDTELYQLPHSGALVRLDALQFGHAMLLRDAVKNHGKKLYFVLDSDPGLSPAFVYAFRQEIFEGRAAIAKVAFEKGLTNGERNQAVEEGRDRLKAESGLNSKQLNSLTDQEYADLVDSQVAIQLAKHVFGKRPSFHWPYHTKSGPMKKVDIVTDDTGLDCLKKARLVRLATLRSVNSYFHRVRSNLRFAARPSVSYGGGGQTWDRYFLYRPDTMAKVIEIYRFAHNWLGDRKTKETPAMRLGLAKGKIYEPDLFGQQRSEAPPGPVGPRGEPQHL